MGIIRRKISMNWLALGLLVVLSAGVAVPIVKLWVPKPVTCGMACCEASGVCYCQMEHAGERASSDGIKEKESESVELDVANIRSSCPAQCAQIPAGFQKHSIAKVSPPSLAFATNVTRQLLVRSPHVVRSALVAEAYAPRAPPNSFLA